MGRQSGLSGFSPFWFRPKREESPDWIKYHIFLFNITNWAFSGNRNISPNTGDVLCWQVVKEWWRNISPRLSQWTSRTLQSHITPSWMFAKDKFNESKRIGEQVLSGLQLNSLSDHIYPHRWSKQENPAHCKIIEQIQSGLQQIISAKLFCDEKDGRTSCVAFLRVKSRVSLR